MKDAEIATELEQVRGRALQRLEAINAELAPLQARVSELVAEATRIRTSLGIQWGGARTRAAESPKEDARTKAVLDLLRDQECITTGMVVEVFRKSPELQGDIRTRSNLQSSASRLLTTMVNSGQLRREKIGLYTRPAKG